MRSKSVEIPSRVCSLRVSDYLLDTLLNTSRATSWIWMTEHTLLLKGVREKEGRGYVSERALDLSELELTLQWSQLGGFFVRFAGSLVPSGGIEAVMLKAGRCCSSSEARCRLQWKGVLFTGSSSRSLSALRRSYEL